MKSGFINGTKRIRTALAAVALLSGAIAAQGNTLTPLTNVVACAGDNATFSTTAAGPKPWKFSWYKDGTLLPGRTNSSLTITNVSAASVGTYTVILQGGQNNATNSATLTLKTPVSATPLADLIRSVGSSALFSTVASGTGPFTYQWRKGNTVLTGQTNSSLTLTNLQTTDSGTYTVIVNGACGSSVSRSATLTVDTCFPAVDVMLVLDRSGSMTGKPYDDARQAGSNFVHNLHLFASGDQAGLVSYNFAATLDQKLTNSVPALEMALHSIPAPNGQTSITLGLQTAQAELASSRHNPQALPVLVLLSDGLPTGSDTKSNALAAATQAKNAGTRIFTVGLGGVDPVLMAGIASSTNDYFFTTNSAQLSALFDAISTVICRPPTNIFVTGLSNQTVCAGSPAVFNIAASGCSPFTYQWKKDGAVLAGQTNNLLVIPSATAANQGLYSVEVTGPCRTVTNSATLTVNQSVSISTPLSSLTNCPGSTAVFTVGATGTVTGYQWYQGTNLLAGETGSTLTLTNVDSADAGIYRVVIFSACGNPLTNSATLTLLTPVSIVQPPVDQINCPGTTATFNVSATGSNLSYQWFKDGALLAGKTAASLAITNVNPLSQGIYSVIVSGPCNSISNSAVLTVNTMVSGTPLASQTNCAGTTVIFSTSASGSGPFTYQWSKDSTPLTGETNATLIVNNVTANNAGTYTVVVLGACGSVSHSADLVVLAPLSATPLTSLTNCAGTTAAFSTIASGSGPITFQWRKGAGDLAGETNASLVLNNVSTNDAGVYSVIVTGACGSVTNAATLSVNRLTTATPLASLVRNPGEAAVFTTTASGTGPFSYLWKKNGTIISGATNNSLMLNPVSFADEGTYTVEVTGTCNTAVQSASLHINLPPTVDLISPTNGAIFIAPASFTLAANATDPDDTVTNVTFFSGGTAIGSTTIGNPFVLSLTNLPAGTNTFTAIAVDSFGATGTSAPVNVIILAHPPLTITNAIHFNPQTGLFDQNVRVSNPTRNAFSGVRVNIFVQTNAVHVYNPSGTTNGVPYVQSPGPVPPGGFVDFVIEYYVTAPGVVPNPTLVAEVVPAPGGGGVSAVGTQVPVNRVLLRPDGSFLVEFASLTNRVYYVQYSADMVNWLTAVPSIAGNGTWIQWIDSGPPKTLTHPGTEPARYYRVILLP